MAIFGASDAPAKGLGLITRTPLHTFQSALTDLTPAFLLPVGVKFLYGGIL